MVYANELIFGAFTLKQCSSRLVIEILKISWLRLRCWQWVWVKIIMSRAIKREPKSPICVVGIGIKSWLNCLEKLSFFGCWKSLSAASKCRKTHPCDYRISGALRALPIPCPGVKLSCPPVQNLNEPPADKTRQRRQVLCGVAVETSGLLSLQCLLCKGDRCRPFCIRGSQQLTDFHHAISAFE